MKISEFLDKTDEKIDYLFKHGKNADERCYDFFIRTVTFFVVVLIVLCYGSFVHADGNEASTTFTTFGNEYGNVEVFTSQGLNDWLQNEGYETTDFSTIGMCGGLSSYLFNASDLPNCVIPDSVTYDGNTYTPEDYIVILGGSNLQDYGVKWLSVYVIVGPDVILGNGGTMVYSFDNNFGIFRGQVNQNNLGSLYPDNPKFNFYAEGNHVESTYQTGYYYYSFSNLGNNLAWTNSPCYTVLKDANTDAMYNDFALVHYRQPDSIFQINYQYAIANPEPDPEPEVESNKNNTYLEFCNVGLTSANNILNSDIVIAMKYNSWMQKYINDYRVDIQYVYRYNGEPWSNGNVNNPIVATYYDSVPLAVFANQNGYQMDFISLGNKLVLRDGSNNTLNNETMSTMFNKLSACGMYTYVTNQNSVTPDKIYDGATALYHINQLNVSVDDIKALYNLFSSNLTPTVGENSVYLTECSLEVQIRVSSNQGDNLGANISNLYSKKFNFLSGEETTNYDIYHNNYPWEGEGGSNQQGQPITDNSINTGGGSVANGGNVNFTGNSINVTSGNGYKDTELHRLSQDDIEQNHINIIETIESLRTAWQRFGSTKQEHNSFLRFILTEYGEIPGVALVIASLFVICLICVIVFFIKIAF